jgi:hypothetical protein
MSNAHQRFQFRLRHLFLIVTLLCVFLAVSIVFPGLAFVLALVVVVGSAMASVSTKSPHRWIVGPIFALAGGFGCFLLGMSSESLAGSFKQSRNYSSGFARSSCRSPALSSAVGTVAGWNERSTCDVGPGPHRLAFVIGSTPNETELALRRRQRFEFATALFAFDGAHDSVSIVALPRAKAFVSLELSALRAVALTYLALAFVKAPLGAELLFRFPRRESVSTTRTVAHSPSAIVEALLGTKPLIRLPGLESERFCALLTFPGFRFSSRHRVSLQRCPIRRAIPL